MIDEEELADLRKAKAKEKEQTKQAQEARTVDNFQFL